MVIGVAPTLTGQPAPEPREEPPREARREPPAAEPRHDRSPVIEDIAPEWNGPLPGFLSKSAG